DGEMIARVLEGLAVTVANDNSPEQVVVSGLGDAVRAAERRLADGAGSAMLRLVPLDVSAPFHSPLMAPIEPAFAAVLEGACARAKDIDERERRISMTFPSHYWAVVLGGSSGFGLASAQKLAEHGMNCFLVHRDRRGAMARIEPEFEQIRRQGVSLVTMNV